MASKQARGTKRTCQNDECSARFYDLDRDPILCPICGATYVLASAPMGEAAAEEEKAKLKPTKKPEFAAGKDDDDTESADTEEDTLEDIETSDDDDVGGDDDETFLEEEEEEGGDLSKVIGGPVAEGNEES